MTGCSFPEFTPHCWWNPNLSQELTAANIYVISIYSFVNVCNRLPPPLHDWFSGMENRKGNTDVSPPSAKEYFRRHIYFAPRHADGKHISVQVGWPGVSRQHSGCRSRRDGQDCWCCYCRRRSQQFKDYHHPQYRVYRSHAWQRNEVGRYRAIARLVQLQPCRSHR